MSNTSIREITGRYGRWAYRLDLQSDTLHLQLGGPKKPANSIREDGDGVQVIAAVDGSSGRVAFRRFWSRVDRTMGPGVDKLPLGEIAQRIELFVIGQEKGLLRRYFG